jgi:hypothetical protein
MFVVVLALLFLLVALAAASFFRHKLATFLVLLTLPVVVLLHALIGTFYAAFAVAGLVIVAALIQTITSSLTLLREANAAPTRALKTVQAQGSARRSSRSRIAA